MENSVTVLWDVQPKFFQYIYCQGTVEVSLALDTVGFPLIADRRSVIVELKVKLIIMIIIIIIINIINN